MTFTLLASICVLGSADERLLRDVLAGWFHVIAHELRLPAAPPPPIFLADRHCRFRVEASPRGTLHIAEWSLEVTGAEHGGTIDLPNGARLPLAGMAFASRWSGSDSVFLYASLPDVWAADPVHADTPEDWYQFLRPVLIHELTHTRQLAGVLPGITAAARALGLSQVDDDIIQERFGEDSAFSTMVIDERDRFLQVAVEASAFRRCAELGAALTSLDRRHRRFFGPPVEDFVVLESLFLDLEGAAQWAALRALRAGPMQVGTPQDAIDRVRDNRKWWSQEYGLALYLALDATVANWQQAVLAPPFTSSFVLLGRYHSTQCKGPP